MVGIMGLGSIVGRLSKEQIGRAVFRIAAKERIHISKSEIDRYGSTAYIGQGDSVSMQFADDEKRYAAALDLTYDTVLTFYELNARQLFVVRFYDEVDKVLGMSRDFIKRTNGKKGIEARIIGMQSNQYPYNLERLVAEIEQQRARIVELDVFGTEKRHIAVDSKLGMSMDILTEDRLYRPGELNSNIQLSEFKAAAKAQRDKRQ